MTTVINGSSPSITFSDNTTQTTAFTTTPIINTITSAASTALTLQSAGTTAVTVDTSQNVGIGNSSPSTYANGFAPVFVTGSSPNWFIAQGRTDGPTGATNGVRIGGSYSTNPITGSNIFFGAQGGSGQQGMITFNTKSQNDNTTQPAEAMRIDSGGNVLIGTGTSGGFTIYPSYSRAGSTAAIVNHITGSASGESYFQFQYAGTGIGSITQTGTTAVLYNTTSDYRLKTDAKPIKNAITTINALNPISFTWVDGRKDDGFLAHEIQSVIPNCVTGEKDAVDKDGNPIYQQMDNSGVIPFLVKAIQEQQALIESLTTRLTALESK
jgi:hypothetical protein